jgi:cell division protease FtsH
MPDFGEAMDKIVLGTRQALLLDESERRAVAYHEAGHALVAKLTPGADPVSKVTIIPHGRALGVTEQLAEEDRHNYGRDYLVGRLAVMLGGRAAEELALGQPTTGAESDLKQATALARRMVGVWGMSEEVGPVAYGLGEVHPFLGRELREPPAYAPATAAELDRAVRGLIDRALARARSLLETHRAVLDALATELLAHETIEGQRLDELLAGGGDDPRQPGTGKAPAAYR